jgi:hypothetical protein
MAVAAVLGTLLIVASAQAQHAGHEGMSMPGSDDAAFVHLMAQAIPLVTRADPTPGGAARTEAALTQAILMARAGWWRGRAALDLTLDGEGVAMPGGELSLGAFGEGFADRRHPHTYLHELVLTGIGHAGPMALSASVGRGFAPFGTDDPMVRAFVKYPVNHHLAQILERGLLMGAARTGPLAIEVGMFTGEEPQRPSSLPLLRRFGDSWSTRATFAPGSPVELQASVARLASPEVPNGFGLDQRKQSASARVGARDGFGYLLAEWARTVERDHTKGEDAFAYETALVEGAVRVTTRGAPMLVALRLEQTGRPEEERLADPFHTARPATDLHIAGITRWRSATLHVDAPAVTWSVLAGLPFLEISRLAAQVHDPLVLFSPEAFYGRSRFWMVTAGIRLRAGDAHGRMGRYGVARF